MIRQPINKPGTHPIFQKVIIWDVSLFYENPMATHTDLLSGSLVFEQKHNRVYRYSKLGGKTPLKALKAAKQKLRFPKKENAPEHPLKKPESGYYHLVRFISSNRKLDIFGELFPVSVELQYEYVVATIDVKEQKLSLYLEKNKVDEFNYNYVKRPIVHDVLALKSVYDVMAFNN